MNRYSTAGTGYSRGHGRANHGRDSYRHRKHRYHSHRLWRRQSGSAIVEFSILLGVLLPVGMGIVMIGKLTDIRQTSEQASRYAAWEATVYSRLALGSPQNLAIEQRFFQASDEAITTTPDQDRKATVNRLWGASGAQPTGLLELASVSRVDGSNVVPAFSFDTGKAKAAALTGKTAAAAGGVLSGLNGNSWGLVADGMLRTTVDVAIKPTGLMLGMPSPCGNASQAPASPAGNTSNANRDKRVCIRTAGVILADGWSASGDAQAKSRVRSLVPTSALSSVGKVFGKLLGSTIFPELDSLQTSFGHVDVRVLPAYAKP